MNNYFALEIKDLSFSYQSKKALDNIHLKLKPSQCNILLGANGAGKSTLFSLITRLYDSHEGQIKLCGFDIKQHTQQALSKLGVVFQQSTLDMDLTVMQNLHYHTALHGMKRSLANQRIQIELERLNMFDRRFESIRQLNGGHRRRVEIARALLHQPTLLLLDEPTVGLDMPSRQALVDYIHKLVKEQQLAVLWATHLIDEIHTDDQLIMLHQGKIKQQGSVSTILKATQSETINQAFQSMSQGFKS